MPEFITLCFGRIGISSTSRQCSTSTARLNCPAEFHSANKRAVRSVAYASLLCLRADLVVPPDSDAAVADVFDAADANVGNVHTRVTSLALT